MQKLLSSKLLGLAVRGPLLRAMIPNAFMIAHTLPLHHFSTEKGGNSESIPSYDGIINSISNAENVNQVLEAFTKAGTHYRNEQIVLSLRMLGRLIRTKADNFSKDERFVKLQERMVESIDTLSDHELLDLLFWLRKSRMFKIALSLSDKDTQRLFFRINDFVKSKSYSCRNLINIYFDYSHMNQNTDSVASEILSEVRQDPKILTTFSCIQIIQAASYRQFLSVRDYQLLNQIIRVIPTFEQDFDIEQKSSIFKHLSKLELNFTPPRFAVPNLLYRIKDQLKEKIEQLGELAVNNVINAYEYLPKEFPNDLLEEIKEMMCVTIQHNPKVITSAFLLGIYESLHGLKSKKRRIQEQKLAILEKELLQRVKDGDQELCKFRSIETMLGIYQKSAKKDEETLKCLYDAFAKGKAKESKLSGLFAIELFAKNKLDVRSILDQELARGFEAFKPYTLIQLFNLLVFLSDEKYKQAIEELRPKIQELVQKDPVVLLRALVGSEIQTPLKLEFLPQLVPELIKVFESKEMNERFFFRMVFESCVNKTMREEWLKYFKSQTERLNKEEYLKTRMIEALGSIEDPENEALPLLFNVFTLSKPTYNDLRKLMLALKENPRLLFAFERSDFLMQRFAKALLEIVQTEPEKVRLPLLYQTVLKINSIRSRNSYLYPVLELYLQGNSPFDTITQMQAALFLLNKKSLGPKTAEAVLKKLEGLKTQYESQGKTRLLSQSATLGAEPNPKTIEALQKSLPPLKEALNNPNPRLVLNTLSVILGFPPEVIKDDMELLRKTLGDFLQQGNSNTYLTVLKGLPEKYVRKNRGIYMPILKELASGYSVFSQRMQFPDVLDCLEIFSELGVRNPAVYNAIIESIGKNFNGIRVEDHIDILRGFSYVGLKQIDLFDKILQRILDKPPFSLRVYFTDIMSSLFALGYDSEFIRKELPNMLTTVGILNQPQQKSLAAALPYIPILDLADELALLESLAQKLLLNLKSPEGKGVSYQVVNGPFSLGLLYLRVKGKAELVAAIEQALSERDKESLEKLRNAGAKLLQNQGKKKAIEMIEQFLQAMKLPYQLDYTVSSVPIDIYIPSQKLLIKVLPSRDLNYDRKSLKGAASLITKIYKSLEGHQTVQLSVPEFLSNTDNLSKVRYLQELGVKSEVKESEFDFSVIKFQERQQRKPKEVVEEVEEEADELELPEKDKTEKVKETAADEVEEKIVKK